MIAQKLLTRRQFLAFLPTLPMAIKSKLNVTNESTFNPKFKIGDYVECRFELGEDPNWYERGEIVGITLESDGSWDYDFIIRGCPEEHFLGQIDQAYEEQLTRFRR